MSQVFPKKRTRASAADIDLLGNTEEVKKEMLETEHAIVYSPVVRYTLTHRSKNFRSHRSVVPWTVHVQGISNIRHNTKHRLMPCSAKTSQVVLLTAHRKWRR